VTGRVAAAGLEPATQELEEQLTGWSVPGLELAVVHGGEVVFAGGFGVRGVPDQSPCPATTLFQHGSCGKASTSLLAAVLVAQGRLDLDTPVRRYVPELTLPDPVVAERVTTRDLLANRSGLARHDIAWILNPSWGIDEVVRRLASFPLAGDLRVAMGYSNLGYALAGLVTGRAAGSSWDEALAEHVLRPAGMARSTTSLERLRADPDAATAHLVLGEEVVPTSHRDLHHPTAQSTRRAPPSTGSMTPVR